MKAEAFDLPGYPRSHTVAVKMLKRKLLYTAILFIILDAQTLNLT